MTTVEIRPAASADLDLIVGWGHAFFEHLRTATADPWFEGATFDAAALEARLRDGLAKGDLLRLAEIGGTPAGYLYGGLERPFIRESPAGPVGHVSHVWVEPWARGRGAARALLADAETWFRARGATWVELSYQPANTGAAAAWTTLGFEPYRLYARKRL